METSTNKTQVVDLYVHSDSAISLATCSLFFFRRVAADSNRWAAAVLAIGSAIGAAIFLCEKMPRAEWIDIDLKSAVVLLCPIITLVYERFKRGSHVVSAETVKNTAKKILPMMLALLFWGCVIGAVYNGIPGGMSDGSHSITMNARQQIIELSPWADYTGLRWLFIHEDGTYKIETGAPAAADSMKTITTGNWSFDPATNVLTLLSAASQSGFWPIERFNYLLQSEQAFLGNDPIEGTPLGKVWFAMVPPPD